MEQPECQMGYTGEQVARIMGNRLGEFHVWMHGQTRSLCEGPFKPEWWEYIRAHPEFYGENPRPACEVAHGGITSEVDVLRFLERRPVID